jgi:hypothetical protein
MSSSSSAWNYSNTVPKVDLNNPDEMIRANGAAEAAQTDRLKAEVEDYAQVVSELRELYEENNELVQKLQFMNRNATEGVRTLLEDNNRQITEKLAELEAWDHKAFESEMRAAISDAREQIVGSIRESSGAAQDLFQEANEFNHGDNVRVYRNVQASMIAELSKQTQELNEKLDIIQKQSEPDKSQSTMHKVSIGLLIAVIAVQLLEGAGLIALLMGMVH